MALESEECNNVEIEEEEEDDMSKLMDKVLELLTTSAPRKDSKASESSDESSSYSAGTSVGAESYPSPLQSRVSKPCTMKIVFFSDSYVDKTKIIRQFMGHDQVSTKYTQTLETLGAAISTKAVPTRYRTVNIRVWDTFGKDDHLKQLIKLYNKKVDAVVLCYRAATLIHQPKSSNFETIKYCAFLISDNFWKCKIYLCGTDTHLLEEANGCRTIELSEVQEFAETISAQVFEVSIEKRTTTTEMFMTIAEDYAETQATILAERGMNIVLLGSTVGKTSLIIRFVYHEFRNPIANNLLGEVFHRTSQTIENIDFQLMILDQPKEESADDKDVEENASNYHGADAIILCYDLTKNEATEDSFETVQNYVAQIKQSSEANIYICGTKSDLLDQKETNRMVDKRTLGRLCQRCHVPAFDTSSKVNSGIDHMFKKITYDYGRRKDLIKTDLEFEKRCEENKCTIL